MTSQERFIEFVEENRDLALRVSVLDCQIAIRRLLDDLAAAREDVADLTWISANLNRDAQGNDVPFIVSTVMRDVLLHCPPMGSKYPHLRAAVRAARTGGTR